MQFLRLLMSEAVVLIYMLWLGAVRTEMSKIPPNAMDRDCFLFRITKICVAFLSRVKKKPLQTFKNWEPSPKRNHAEG